MSAAPTLSVITVSWNVRELLLQCMQSVAASCAAMPYEHIVVDNASDDGSADAVEREFPDAVLIRNTDNAGFARANNVAARRARGRYLLFLNPDTKVLDDALPVMVQTMERRQEIGVLGSKLLRGDLRWSRDMGYRAPTLRTVFNECLMLSRLIPFPALVPGIMRSTDFEGLERCDWVSGASLMVRREIAEQEPWNEEIFFFAEEIEHCDRIRRRGWEICCTADARVIHYSGSSMAKQSTDFLDGKASGLAVYLRKRRGPLVAWIAVQTVRLGYLSRVLYHRASYRLNGDPASLEKSRRLRQYLRLDSRGNRVR